MATTQTAQKSQSLPTTNHKPVEPVKVPDSNATPVTTAVEPTAPATPSNPEGEGDRVILSLSVTPKFAKQCRMLAKLTGKSMSTLVISIVEAEVRAQLKTQLAQLRDEVE